MRGRCNTEFLFTLGNSWVVDCLNIMAIVFQEDVGEFSVQLRIPNLKQIGAQV